MANVIEAIDLHKTYVLGKVSVEALNGVSFSVEKGDFVSILGPSGSGKSTLLNLIGALDKPTAGRLFLNGVDTSTLNDNQFADIRRQIGFVFQFFNLIPRFTAKQNIELPMAISGMSRDKRSKRAQELISAVGLSERAKHKPAELSGGQRQRVAIARALANNPDFLLMDEPTGNIDSKTAAEIIALIKELNEKRGVTIVMVTHNNRLAEKTKRTVHMLDGKIVKEREIN